MIHNSTFTWLLPPPAVGGYTILERFNIYLTPMTTTWKIAIPVGLVVLATAAAIWWRTPSSPPTTVTSSVPSTTQENSEPVSTVSQAADDGSADAIVAELLQIAAAEQNSFNEETGDASLISSDSAELNSLLTSYDDSQY
ncbi:MAG TPA: hypothetical protein VJA28_00325 [Patescibacteria group bacterium]|nr:hypothetical protein [Patescibacteria group bacterium]